MDVFIAISHRKNVQTYKNKIMEEDVLRRVLEAGRIAPSAGNRQDWKFIAVKDHETRRKLAIAAKGQMSLEQAPIVIVGCAVEPTYIMMCGQSAGILDVTIEFSFMMLEATEQGLGTCWIGAFDEAAVKKILNVPDQVRVVAMTPLGHPDETPAGRPRKSFEEVFCENKFRPRGIYFYKYDGENQTFLIFKYLKYNNTIKYISQLMLT
jgi:nitroreductase